MSELVQANWWLFVLALLIGIAAAWWIFVASRKTHVATTRSDVLDEGGAPAKRNQALIDAPAASDPAVQVPEPTVSSAIPGPVTADPAVAAAPPSTAPTASTAAGDDLKRIKGIGPKLEALLNTLGITSYSQIAGWSDTDIDRIDAQLGTFEGRIRRDSWIEQARFLAADDMAGFEGKFGKL